MKLIRNWLIKLHTRIVEKRVEELSEAVAGMLPEDEEYYWIKSAIREDEETLTRLDKRLNGL